MVSHLVNTSPTLAAEMLISVDHYRRTPLHYTVDAGNLSVFAFLLDALSQISLDEQSMSQVRATLGSILVLTLRARADEMAKMVLEHGPDLLHRSSRGETALYCAAQLGNLPLARLLVCRLSSYALGIDVIEKTRGWTSLTVACANGHTHIAKRLLQASAKQNSCDARGWTALEHAVFRGHHVVAELFKSHQPSTGLDGPASAIRAVHKASHAVCKAGERILIVYLVSTQGSHDRPTMQLGSFSPNTSDEFHQARPLELQISVLGTTSAAKTLQLPLLENQSHKPLVFKVEHDMPLQIVLNIYHCEVVNRRVLVSSGTSLLDQENILGDKHESLIRERTIYMMDKEKLCLTGTVLLSYLVAKPYSGLEKTDASSCLTPEEGLVRLVGHRGMSVSHSSDSE
jgi:glycerophosphodiester phosphodiesterase